MFSRTPIDSQRIRKITGSFSWLDHRLLTGGFLAAMQAEEMLLYFFLVLVGDRQGLSFYGYEKICALLHLDVDRLIEARQGLIGKSLIAYDQGLYQVLQLPATPVHQQGEALDVRRLRCQELLSFADILQKIPTLKGQKA